MISMISQTLLNPNVISKFWISIYNDLVFSNKGVGTGNDFYGWEFHKYTKIAYGTIVTEEVRWENPAPTRMFWRPDKMIVEYELSNPYVQGIAEGWCSNWNQGSDQDPGDSFWIDLTEEECWKHCNDDFSCFQVDLYIFRQVPSNFFWNVLKCNTNGFFKYVVIYSKFY